MHLNVVVKWAGWLAHVDDWLTLGGVARGAAPDSVAGSPGTGGGNDAAGELHAWSTVAEWSLLVERDVVDFES